jgi:hypothetical protein
MKAIKILTEMDDGRFTGWTEWWDYDKGGVIYRRGYTAKPRKQYGPLCAFSTIDDAQNAHPANYRFAAWCEVEQSRRHRVWDMHGFAASLVDLPDGTILCESIRLLEEPLPVYEWMRRNAEVTK